MIRWQVLLGVWASISKNLILTLWRLAGIKRFLAARRANPVDIEAGATTTIAKILAKHRISGMSDAYIKWNPKMAADACDAIGKAYGFRCFG